MTPKPTKLWGNTVTVGGASRGDALLGIQEIAARRASHGDFGISLEF